MKIAPLLYYGWLLGHAVHGQNDTVSSQNSNQNGENEVVPPQEINENGQNETTSSPGLTYDDITLDDVFISVKTTHKNHNSRLLIILLTWYQLAKEQIWFFTDRENQTLQEYTHGRMVNTHCPSSHNPFDLCCKMNVEFDYYLGSGKKWFCHFDDDNYVNVPKLAEFLKAYDHKLNWYLGKRSVPYQFQVRLIRLQNMVPVVHTVSFSFATGGAGICISASLAIKMSRYIRDGRFLKQCRRIQHADDVTVGFIIEYLMEVPLTEVSKFHSHLENLTAIDYTLFSHQISFSYALPSNFIHIPGVDFRNDTTRFLNLHCFLFPNLDNVCTNI